MISNTKKKSLQVTYLHYALYTMKDDLRGGCKEVNTKYTELMWVYIIKKRN